MTRKELSQQFDISESSIKTQFPKLQEKFLTKHGLILTKTGRGEKADYQVSSLTGDHAYSMLKEKNQEVLVAKEGFSNLVDFNFMVFLAICATPMTTFYGNYENFLTYVELPINKSNIKLLKEALTFLHDKKYINFVLDETNTDYFWAGLYFATRQKMSISLDMVERCQAIAAKNNKHSWVPILKTWIGIQYMYDKQPFTMKQLSALTGLSAYQIRESKRLLEQDNLFVTSKAYACYDLCIGTNVELNGINDANRNYVMKSREGSSNREKRSTFLNQ